MTTLAPASGDGRRYLAMVVPGVDLLKPYEVGHCQPAEERMVDGGV